MPLSKKKGVSSEESGSRSSLRKSPRKRVKRKIYNVGNNDDSNEDDYDDEGEEEYKNNNDIEDEEDETLVFDGVEKKGASQVQKRKRSASISTILRATSSASVAFASVDATNVSTSVSSSSSTARRTPRKTQGVETRQRQQRQKQKKSGGWLPFPALPRGAKFVTSYGVVEVLNDNRIEKEATTLIYPMNKQNTDAILKELKKVDDRCRRKYVHIVDILKKSRKSVKKKWKNLYHYGSKNTTLVIPEDEDEYDSEEDTTRNFYLSNAYSVSTDDPMKINAALVANPMTVKGIQERMDPRAPEDSSPDRIVECILISDDRRLSQTCPRTYDDRTMPNTIVSEQQPTILYLRRRDLVNEYDPSMSLFMCPFCGKKLCASIATKQHMQRGICQNKQKPLPYWHHVPRKASDYDLKRDYKAERIRREEKRKRLLLEDQNGNTMVSPDGKLMRLPGDGTTGQSPNPGALLTPLQEAKRIKNEQAEFLRKQLLEKKKYQLSKSSFYPEVYEYMSFRLPRPVRGRRKTCTASSGYVVPHRLRPPWYQFTKELSAVYPEIYRSLTFKSGKMTKDEKERAFLARNPAAAKAREKLRAAEEKRIDDQKKKANDALQVDDPSKVSSEKTASGRKRRRKRKSSDDIKDDDNPNKKKRRRRRRRTTSTDEKENKKNSAEQQKLDTTILVDVSVLVEEIDTGRYPSMKRYKGAHQDFCVVCKSQEGVKYCCEFCPQTNHMQCLKSKVNVKEPKLEDDFMCHSCIQRSLARRARAEKRRLAKRDVFFASKSSKSLSDGGLAILAASVNASAQAAAAQAEASASSEGNMATRNNSKSMTNAKGSSGELLASSSVSMRVDVDAIKNNDATDNKGGNNGNPNELIDVEKQMVNDKCFFFGNCPKGGPGGLNCCETCSMSYFQYMTAECNRGDLSTVAMLGRETNELVELLSDARQRLAMAEEISREHDYRRSLFEDCEVNESASYYT